MHGPLKTHVALPAEHATARRTLTFWALQIVISVVYFRAQASGEAIFASVPWESAERMWGIETLAHLTLTTAIRAISKRYGWLALAPRPLLWRVIPAVLIVTLLTFGLTIQTALWIYGQPVPPILATFYQKLSLENQLFNTFVNALLIYAAWVCGSAVSTA